MSRPVYDDELWAAGEADRLRRLVYPNDYAYSQHAWSAGIMHCLLRMVQRSGYTRQTAIYEVEVGLGLRSPTSRKRR